jgi:hypothetical protein
VKINKQFTILTSTFFLLQMKQASHIHDRCAVTRTIMSLSVDLPRPRETRFRSGFSFFLACMGSTYASFWRASAEPLIDYCGDVGLSYEASADQRSIPYQFSSYIYEWSIKWILLLMWQSWERRVASRGFIPPCDHAPTTTISLMATAPHKLNRD